MMGILLIAFGILGIILLVLDHVSAMRRWSKARKRWQIQRLVRTLNKVKQKKEMGR